MKKITFLFFFAVLASTFSIYSQTDAGVKIISKQGDLYNEVKELSNPYSLPVGAKKLGAKGFLLPYPIGIMLNGYVGNQDVSISNLSVGLNDEEMVNLDKVVGFSGVNASVKNFNMRADLWALPFLDVYGLFGKAWVETDVNIGSIAQKTVNFGTQANFDGYVYGFGAMLTGGVRSVFFSLDFNKVWTHFEELQDDNTATSLTPRVGYIFHFTNKPERNISVWVGSGRVFLNNETEGRIPLAEVLPNFGQNYQNSDWYQALGPANKQLIVKVLNKAAEHVDKVEIHYYV